MAIGDTDLPVISFDPTSYRFDEGSGYVTFTLVLSEASSSDISVEYGTEDGTADGYGIDYGTQTSTRVTFAAGSLTATARVFVGDDARAEPDESFLVTLHNPSGATFGGLNHSLRASGFILDDDAGGGDRALAVAAPVVVEGSGTATFTISLSEAFSTDTVLNFATLSDSAVAGSDFTAQTGTITFLSGQTEATVDVVLLEDSQIEPGEAFGLSVTGPGGLAGFGRAELLDDDSVRPAISIDSVRADEGSGYVSFTLRLAHEAQSDVTVSYSTVDGTADGYGVDYGTRTAGTVTFAAGETTATASVFVGDDDLAERDESFFLELSNASSTGFGGRNQTLRATGWIHDDEAGGGDRGLAVAAPVVDEGTGVATFVVSLSRAFASATSLNFATLAGSALSGKDFLAKSGTISFAAGQTEATVSVDLLDDDVAESTENFGLHVTGSGLVATSWAKIVDPDGRLPVISIDDLRATEGSGYVSLTLRLSDKVESDVTVSYSTFDGTADGNSIDYGTQTERTVTFAAGETTATAEVFVGGDTRSESDESFLVGLSNPVGASFGPGNEAPRGFGWILDDDPGAQKRAIAVTGVTASENGGDGAGKAAFTIHLSRAFDSDVTLDYATSDGSARAGSDYVARQGSVTLAAGSTEAVVAVSLINNLAREGNETFALTLSDLPSDLAPTGNVVRATSTITDGSVLGTGGVDRLSGSAFPDVIYGLGGNDRLYGLGGNDRLYGGAGNDRLDGGTGADRMSGGAGNDTYVVDSRHDLVIEAQNAGRDGVRSAVSLALAENVENLTLTATRDINATGNALANRLAGNAGDNVLAGGGGADRLAGNDGDDIFRFGSAAAAGRGRNHDTIADFVRGDDIIDLHRIDADSGHVGNQTFDFVGSHAFGGEAGELRFSAGLLSADTDGDGHADLQLAVTGLARLGEADFIL